MATTRQLAVIKDVLENKTPVSVAMVKNGYSKATAHNPDKITKSDAWKAMVAQYLPDYKILQTHQEALKATKWNDFTGEREEDHGVRLKAVDMAYKLKGKGDNGGNTNTQINITLDSSGYIPPNNVLGIKPTLSIRPTKQPKP